MPVTNLTHERIPITIGITGHRHIANKSIAEIENRLREVLQYLKQSYADSPLILLSPLAEGADQLTANIAFELDIELYAILPMSEDEYRKDFDTPETFNSLLRKASFCKTLNKFDPVSQRNNCYAYVGKKVVDQCEVLIALWDGDFNQLSGGTGEIVNYALTGKLSSLENILEDHEWLESTKPVIHITTPRKNNETTIETRYYKDKKALLEKNNTLFDETNHSLTTKNKVNQFNQAVSESNGNYYPLIDIDNRTLPKHIQFVHNIYLRSDSTANEYQLYFYRNTLLFYSLSTVLMLILLLYYRVFPTTLLISLYLFVYVITIAVSTRIKNSDFQRKYHSFRMMGETFRLFFFLKLLNNNDSQRVTCLENARELQYILRKFGDENKWILESIKKINLFETDNADKHSFASEELIQKHWINDQRKYFFKAMQRDLAKAEKLDLFGTVIFLLSFLSGLFIFAGNFFFTEFIASIKTTLTIMMGAGMGLGGILKTYSYTMGYSELSGRYKLMHELFSKAENNLKADNKNFTSVFDQLWWEALMENIEWFSLKNSRLVRTINIKKILSELSRFFKT